MRKTSPAPIVERVALRPTAPPPGVAGPAPALAPALAPARGPARAPARAPAPAPATAPAPAVPPAAPTPPPSAPHPRPGEAKREKKRARFREHRRIVEAHGDDIRRMLAASIGEDGLWRIGIHYEIARTLGVPPSAVRSWITLRLSRGTLVNPRIAKGLDFRRRPRRTP